MSNDKKFKDDQLLSEFQQLLQKFSVDQVIEMAKTDDAIIDIVISSLQNKDDGSNIKQITILKCIGNERVIARLVPLLKSNRTYLAKAAAKILGETRNSKLVPVLIDAINHEYVQVQESVIIALGELGDSRAIDPIITVFNQKGNEYPDEYCAIGPAVISALTEIGTQQAQDFLLSILENSQIIDEIKEAAAVNLSRFFSDDSGINYLIDVLQNGTVGSQRYAAIRLGLLNDKRAIEPLFNALGTASKSNRKVIVEALKRLEDEKFAAPLIEEMK